MQCLTVIVLVLSLQICSTKPWDKSIKNLKRIKRQDNISWNWGNDDSTTVKPVTQQTTEPPVTWTCGNVTNPCERPLAPKPDFSAPGRRISEIKCYEYIWEIKHRVDKTARFDECLDYRRKYCNERFYIAGRNALPGEFPHMGAIGWKAAVGTWIFKCGSSLISNKFVLTAAHCTRTTSKDATVADVVPKIVRLGDKNILDVKHNGLPPKDANISRIIVHPQYKPPKKYYDIALMELEKEVEFNYNLQPACLWRSFDTSSLGKEAVAGGWGVIDTAGKKTSPNLQVGTLDIIDSQQCDALLRPSCNRNWCGIQDTQLCAGKLAGGSDTCQGDSGGPLQVKIPLPPSKEGAMHYIIGVTSFGIGCAVANKPGVYTRVSSFIDWIENIVWR